MNKKNLQIVVLILILFSCVFTLTGCGKKLESIRLEVDENIAVNDSKLVKVKFKPSDIKEEIQWTSSDEKIATVEDGKITGISEGTVKIIAKTESGIQKSVTISVYMPIEKFELSSSNVEMFIGDEKLISATITPEEATYKKVSWTSEDSNIVSINEEGKIEAKKAGITKVIATTEQGLKRECTVNVKEKPIEFSGSGDKVITGVNIPYGEYIAIIDIDSTRHYDVKWYYGDGNYDYNLLVNNSGSKYSGTTLLKDGDVSAVSNGEIDISSQGSWNIKIQPLSGEIENNFVNGHGDMVTGLFIGTGSRVVFNIKVDSTRHYDVKLYKYNGSKYDYELLVNDSGHTYDGQVSAKLESGYKYFFTICSEGDWSIEW